MKPILVKMQAFGPYIKPTECDFSDLYLSRLFLITGPTGCGKTSILDAMCIALYGSATGEMRSLRDMRNIRAGNDADTEVEFIFELGGNQYRFIRRLHIHTKRSGDIEERLTAECYEYSDGEWTLLASLPTAVTKQAENLLHFTHSQFSQVIVLPQGEFRRLLLANSREKLDILQVLFGLTRWQKISERIRSRQTDLNSRMKSSADRISALLESAEVESRSELSEKINLAHEQHTAAVADVARSSAAFSAAGERYRTVRQLCDRFDALSEAEIKLEKLERRRPEVEEMRSLFSKNTQLQKIIPYFDERNVAQKEFDLQSQNLSICKNALSDAVKTLEASRKASVMLPEIADDERRIRDEIAALAQLIPDIDSLITLKQNSEQAEQKIKESEEKISLAASKISELDRRIANGNQAVSHQIEVISRLTELEKKRVHLTQAIDIFTQLEQAELKKSDAKKSLDDALQKLNNQRLELNAVKAEFERIDALIRSDSAHTLAAGLSDGSPCPVCGSLHHPSPARSADGVPDSVAAAACKKMLDSCNDEFLHIQAETAKAQAALNSAAGEFDRLSNICSQYKFDKSTAVVELSHTEADIAEAESAKQNHQRYLDALEKLKTSRTEADGDLAAANEQKARFMSELSSVQAKIESITARLPDGDPSALKSHHAELCKKADGLHDRYVSIEKAFSDAKLLFTSAEEKHNAAVSSAESAKKRFDTSQSTYEQKCGEYGISPKDDIKKELLPDTELNSIKNQIEQFDNELNICTSRKKELSDALRDITKPDIKAETELYQAASASHETAVSAEAALKAQLDNLRSVGDNIDRIYASQSELNAQYSAVTRVFNFISGKSSRNRVPLQQFVLGLVFDDVMAAATNYLSRLSRGRYALIRTDEENSGGIHGLEIQVADAHTGGLRKVATLSGGELFLASLSLAFGLAEVVQSYSGGIYLDSIFIDEGFGTLDSETLDAAMRALADIQSDGRLVGVISHVSELRDRIPAHIEITPSDSGSTLTVDSGV